MLKVPAAKVPYSEQQRPVRPKTLEETVCTLHALSPADQVPRQAKSHMLAEAGQQSTALAQDVSDPPYLMPDSKGLSRRETPQSAKLRTF